jgi:hypothetical protein
MIVWITIYAVWLVLQQCMCVQEGESSMQNCILQLQLVSFHSSLKHMFRYLYTLSYFQTITSNLMDCLFISFSVWSARKLYLYNAVLYSKHDFSSYRLGFNPWEAYMAFIFTAYLPCQTASHILIYLGPYRDPNLPVHYQGLGYYSAAAV